MPPKAWKTLSSRPIYENNWISLREDVAELPNGHTTIYGVATFGECVGVVPFIDDERILLVRQYRYVQKEDFRWEIPTGGVHVGENLEVAAQRELQEEIGYRAGRLTWLNTTTPPSRSAMRRHISIWVKIWSHRPCRRMRLS